MQEKNNPPPKEKHPIFRIQVLNSTNSKYLLAIYISGYFSGLIKPIIRKIMKKIKKIYIKLNSKCVLTLGLVY